ncbi:MAG TPA: hypothetical protein VL285_07545 [Bryobacteraceae bacterium]|nr:hypothetical protein [Bryobacteraceae bacterium]
MIETIATQVRMRLTFGDRTFLSPFASIHITPGLSAHESNLHSAGQNALSGARNESTDFCHLHHADSTRKSSASLVYETQPLKRPSSASK